MTEYESDAEHDIDKRYVLRSAEFLLTHFGDQAHEQASKVASDFQESGNLEGALLWWRIMKECQRIQKHLDS